MSVRAIKTTEAVIATATVEIRTVSVAGKQMTLALYRQIPREEILAEGSAGFRGLPWGRVNYCLPKECDHMTLGEHLHVIWQKGDELRRALVPLDESHPSLNKLLYQHQRLGDSIAAFLALERAPELFWGDAWHPADARVYVTDRYRTVYRARFGSEVFEIERETLRAIEARWCPGAAPWAPALKQQVSDWEEAWHKGGLEDLAAARARYAALPAIIERTADAWSCTRTELRALPQLFIAA
jgi:hypothetical protein